MNASRAAIVLALGLLGCEKEDSGSSKDAASKSSASPVDTPSLNPRFEAWVECKPGSWMKAKVERLFGEKYVEEKYSAKLISIDAGKVVVEESETARLDPNAAPTESTRKREYPPQPDPRVQIVKQEKVDVEIAGKKFSGRRLDTVFDSPAGFKVNIQLWIVPEIPGIARIEQTPEGGTQVTSRSVAVEWEKK